MAQAPSWERKRGLVLTGKKRKREKTTIQQPTGFFQPSAQLKEAKLKLRSNFAMFKLLHDDPSGVFADFTPARASIKKKKKEKSPSASEQRPIAARDKIRVRKSKTTRITRAGLKEESL